MSIIHFVKCRWQNIRLGSTLKKEKLLFVCPGLSPFIKEDIRILSSQYTVVVSQYDWSVKWRTPLLLIMQAVYLLFYINSLSRIVVSFGGYWSFFPALIGKLFNVPVLIILHGTDCASIPSVGYGSLRNPMVKRILGMSYKWASTLLPVSSSLVNTDNQYYKSKNENRQGLNFFYPMLKTKINVVFNGLDSSFWKIGTSEERKEKSFVTVFSKSQFVLKGGDLILKIAEVFPNYTFNLVGLEKPEYIENHSDNVVFLGRKTQSELLEIYNMNSYYLQLSIFEGFGMSLCEAMLCGCIPIGSKVNMIPEIISSCGIIVEERSEENLISAISECILIVGKEEYRQKARNRIIDNYDISIRAKRLIENIAC